MAGRAMTAIGARTPVDATRVLLWLYAVLVVAAGARSIVQLALHASRAPVAYSLSVVAAAVYATGLLLLRRAASGAALRPVAVCAAAELAGVLAVGTLGLVRPSAFPDATVWSGYGSGYLWIPLLLPVATLVRLRSWTAWEGR